jgi:hypothetical protein
MPTAMPIPFEERRDADAREAALTYVSEAFALAALDGIQGDALAEAALCAAMCELVAIRGEDGAARVAVRLADRVAAGEFSDLRRH